MESLQYQAEFSGTRILVLHSLRARRMDCGDVAGYGLFSDPSVHCEILVLAGVPQVRIVGWIDYSTSNKRHHTAMIPGIYSAATAMERAAQQHELIADNLSHVNMPGYRRAIGRQQTFESTLSKAEQDQLRFDSLGAADAGTTFDFSHGAFEQTGNPLDLAINGDGFFAIEVPGETLFTRNGTFQVDADGRIVTADGYPVEAENGSLTLPPDSSVTQLKVSADGTATVNGTKIGRIRVVTFSDVHALESAGVTLFRSPESMPPKKTDSAVIQGTREKSNVQPIRELVDLIATTRAHESAERAMQTINDAIERHTQQQGG